MKTQFILFTLSGIMRFRKIIFLFFTVTPGFVYGQLVSTEPYALQDKTVSFMHRLEKELITFVEQADSISNASMEERNTLLQKSVFFREISKYLDENRFAYESVRRQSFEKLTPPPIDLEKALRLTPIVDSSLTILWKEADYARLLTFQSFTAEAIMGLIANTMLPVIVETSSNIYDDLMLDSQIGPLIYGLPVLRDKWQLFMITRHYCIAVDFNLTTQDVDNVRFATLSDSSPDLSNLAVSGNPKTTVDSLSQGLQKIGWSILADTAYLRASHTEILQTLAVKKQQFFLEHLDQYTQVRKTLLSRFPATSVLPTEYRLKISGEELGDTFLQSISFLNPTVFSVETITTQLANSIAGQLSWSGRPDYKALSLKAMMGYLHRVKPTTNHHIWQVQACGYQTLIEYQWDISTGKITDLKYYERI